MKSLKLKAEMESLSPLLEFIRDQAVEKQINPDEIQEVELACEEILVNVIQYAYSEDGGDVEIRVPDRKDGFFEIEITDSGEHFDFLSLPNPDTDSPLKDRISGGLGIHLARQMMDEVSYQRAGGFNKVNLIKKTEAV